MFIVWSMSIISRASLSEELTLRSLTGYLVGQKLFVGYNKLAIVTFPDRICSGLATSVATSFIARNGYRESIVRIFMYEEGSEKKLVQDIINYSPDALFIALGGEQKMSYVNDAFIKLVDNLRKAEFKKPLVLHVRTWLATKQLSSLSGLSGLLDYLRSLPEVRVFTADLQNKRFLFNRIRFTESGVKLEVFDEVSLTDEHVGLLKISLPPPE